MTWVHKFFMIKQGPVLPSPLADPSQISTLKIPDVDKELSYVGEAIKLTRHSLQGKVPLIGFTGAPVRFYQM